MSRSSRAARRAAPRSRRRPHRGQRSPSIGRTIGLTLLSALLPGLGYILGGRKQLGVFVMTIAFGLAGIGAFIVVTRREDVLELAVDPSQLLVAAAVLAGLALCWITIIISSHRLLRPVSVSRAGRAVGAAFVGALCFAIAAPMAVAAQSVMAQRDLVQTVFASEGSSKSATRTQVNKKDPWEKIPRLNLLLLGADDGKGRDGTRTDTVIVASINTSTGDTALMTFPRNTVRMPFPVDSPLHDAYPNGFWRQGVDPLSGDAQEYYLDAMYRNVQAAHPGILGETDNPGADILKLSVGEAAGLKLHYYLQINLEGFEKMVEALGGITVNVNYRVPVGGDDNGTVNDKSDDKLPGRYIEPGPNKHLNGFDALWFARGRYGIGAADNARQVRQRCTISALVDAADPARVLTSYEQIASASKRLLRTDIPQEVLPAFLELALKVKSGKVTNINLKGSLKYGRPDFEGVRRTIAKELNRKPVTKAAKPKPTSSAGPTKRPLKSVTPPVTAQVKDECRYAPTTEQ